MELKLRHYSVLVVSSQPRFNDSLKLVMSEKQRLDFEYAGSVSSAGRLLLDRDYDILIVNAPLSDEDGVRFAIDRSSGCGAAVLLLVQNNYYSEIRDRVCPYGVYAIPKPTSRQMMEQAIDWLEATHERLARIEKKSVSLEEKMQEIRIVNRAKLLLISEQGLTEEAAHERIQRMAMDRCTTKRVIAEELIGMLGSE